MVPSGCRFLAFTLSFVVLCLSWFLAQYYHHKLPAPVTTIKPVDRFVASAAKKHVDRLTNFGPRPAGSYANEVQAVQFLKGTLELLEAQSNSSRVDLELDIQKVDGNYSLDNKFTQKYQGLQNVIARLVPKSDKFRKRPAVLVNCHYDSVPEGPGASDDGVSCAIMLEIIRIILRSKRNILNNDIIFLFNGAEEYYLPASHGFVSNHPWASDVKAVINLEAAGSGGRELLFQSGPGNSWLLNAYIQSAPHPFASVIGQEIFQSGIIPSDTDFRIFRDYGHIPGLDIAYVRNGYVYHTKFDTSDRIPLGSIQRAGDNVLAVVVRLARLKDLGDSSETSSPVFFDLLGMKLISYPSYVGVMVNLSVVVSVGYLALRDAKKFMKKLDLEMIICLKVFLLFILVDILVLVISSAFCAILGLVMGVCGYSMTWYSSPCFLILLYSVPTLYIILHILKYAKVILCSMIKMEPPAYFSERMCLHGVCLAGAGMCLTLTLFGIKSACIFSLSLIWPIFWMILTRHSSTSWLNFTLYNVLLVLPLTMLAYMIQLVFTMFIPIMGRRGPIGNPDIILGVACGLLTTYYLQLVLPVLVSIKRQFLLKLSCAISFTLMLAIIMLFGKGFPFSSNIQNPTPKRISVFHVLRNLPSPQGPVTDGGFLAGSWDYDRFSHISLLVPEYLSGERVSEDSCQNMLGCGYPQHLRKPEHSVGSIWVPCTPPKLDPSSQTKLHVISKQTKDGKTNITMSVSGPSRIVMLLATPTGGSISSWSLDSKPSTSLEWKSGLPAYYIQLVEGVADSKDGHRMWIEFEGETLVASVSGHYNHGPNMVQPTLRNFLDKHPPWASLSAWTVDFKYYTM